MANVGSFERIWRQSLELNIRYYTAISRLTADYFKDSLAALAESRAAPSQPSEQPNAPAPPSPNAPSPTAASSQQAGVMVLEGDAGGEALGVFLVANNLQHEVSARVVASTFVNANGHTVQPAFTFDPAVIALAPGEQLLVRVTTLMDNALEPEVRYRGEFTVPELLGTRIPIVLRRRPSQAKSPVETNSTVADPLKKTKSSVRRRSTKTKRASGGG
jgi:hypothetical protein